MGSLRLQLNVIALISVAGFLIAGVITAEPASATCLAREISVEPGVISAGGTVSVEGIYWARECYDTYPLPPGADPDNNSVTDIEILLVGNSKVQVAGSASADKDEAFSTQVKIPPSTPAGRWVIIARSKSEPDRHMTTADLTVTAPQSTGQPRRESNRDAANRHELAKTGVRQHPIRLTALGITLVALGTVLVNRERLGLGPEQPT